MYAILTSAFAFQQQPTTTFKSCLSSPLALFPLPVTILPPSIPLDITDTWSFSLLERKDLEMAAQFALDCFYTPRLIMNTYDASETELWLMNAFKTLYEKVDRSDTYNGNYLGFLSRAGNRLNQPFHWNQHLTLMIRYAILEAPWLLFSSMPLPDQFGEAEKHADGFHDDNYSTI